VRRLNSCRKEEDDFKKLRRLLNSTIAQLANYGIAKLPNCRIAELPLHYAENSLTWRADAALSYS